MTPNRTENYCCGGGGGTVSIDEIRAFRTGLMGRRKAEQIRATGATIVVSPCANCKKQLREVCEDHGLDDVTVVGLHDLLLRVIDFGSPHQEHDRVEDSVARAPVPGTEHGAGVPLACE
jgi:Fe-S oxidoreductase